MKASIIFILAVLLIVTAYSKDMREYTISKELPLIVYLWAAGGLVSVGVLMGFYDGLAQGRDEHLEANKERASHERDQMDRYEDILKSWDEKFKLWRTLEGCHQGGVPLAAVIQKAADRRYVSLPQHLVFELDGLASKLRKKIQEQGPAAHTEAREISERMASMLNTLAKL